MASMLLFISVEHTGGRGLRSHVIIRKVRQMQFDHVSALPSAEYFMY